MLADSFLKSPRKMLELFAVRRALFAVQIWLLRTWPGSRSMVLEQIGEAEPRDGVR